MSREEALRRLQHCEREGKIDLAYHFRRRLRERDISAFDARLVIRSGNIYEEAEFDSTHGEWTYTVVGYDRWGRLLKVVFAFKPWGVARLITVMWD